MHCLSAGRLIIKSRCQERRICRMAFSKATEVCAAFPLLERREERRGCGSSSLWCTSEPPDSEIPENLLIPSDVTAERRCREDICLISFRHDVLGRAHTASSNWQANRHSDKGQSQERILSKSKSRRWGKHGKEPATCNYRTHLQVQDLTLQRADGWRASCRRGASAALVDVCRQQRCTR